jgi:hypothetical protein
MVTRAREALQRPTNALVELQIESPQGLWQTFDDFLCARATDKTRCEIPDRGFADHDNFASRSLRVKSNLAEVRAVVPSRFLSARALTPRSLP